MVLKSKVRISSILFRFVVILLTVAVAFLAIGLIGYLLKKGLPYVNRAFLFTEPDILMDSYGIKPMIINTIYTVVLTLIFCIPLGIGSAIIWRNMPSRGKLFREYDLQLKSLPAFLRLYMAYLDLIFSSVKWQLEIMRVRC